MRLLVCGGREWGWVKTLGDNVLDTMSPRDVAVYRERMRQAMTQRKKTFDVLDAIHLKTDGIDVVIHGDARGADRLADLWATSRDVDVERFPADWHGLGRAAGPLRNARMLTDGAPDVVVAFPGGHGTANMIGQALDAGVEVMDLSL